MGPNFSMIFTHLSLSLRFDGNLSEFLVYFFYIPHDYILNIKLSKIRIL
uniref:Uncharacterized protein n=1 Tax=Lepeophtheirus salmonis TaxID=72036 RepID=A0A0K2T4C2_LEPSM